VLIDDLVKSSYCFVTFRLFDCYYTGGLRFYIGYNYPFFNGYNGYNLAYYLV